MPHYLHTLLCSFLFLILSSMGALLMEEAPVQEPPSTKSLATIDEESSLGISFEIPEAFQRLTEKEAQDKAQREYCLCESDKIENWKLTYSLYHTFWENTQTDAVIEELSKKGFLLAQVFLSFGSEEQYFNEVTTENFDELLGSLSNLKLLSFARDIHMAAMAAYMGFNPSALTIPLEINRYDRLIHFVLKTVCHLRNIYIDPTHPIQFPLEPLENVRYNPTHPIQLPLETVEALEKERRSKIDVILTNKAILQKECFLELLRRDNLFFIVMFKQPNPFLAGLSVIDEFTLYEMAQMKYLEKYGHTHTRKYKANHLYREGITEEEIIALEIICKRLISQGDHELTLFLGWSWRCAASTSDDKESEQNAYQRALNWYSQSMKYDDCREKAVKETQIIKLIQERLAL